MLYVCHIDSVLFDSYNGPMKTLGRVFFLILAMFSGAWLALCAINTYPMLRNANTASEAIGVMLVPTLFSSFVSGFSAHSGRRAR